MKQNPNFELYLFLLDILSYGYYPNRSTYSYINWKMSFSKDPLSYDFIFEFILIIYYVGYVLFIYSENNLYQYIIFQKSYIWKLIIVGFYYFDPSC